MSGGAFRLEPDPPVRNALSRGVSGSAIFGGDSNEYRYELRRWWGEGPLAAIVCAALLVCTGGATQDVAGTDVVAAQVDVTPVLALEPFELVGAPAEVAETDGRDWDAVTLICFTPDTREAANATGNYLNGHEAHNGQTGPMLWQTETGPLHQWSRA